MKGYNHDAEDTMQACGISEERASELKRMFDDMRELPDMRNSEHIEMIETITDSTREALLLFSFILNARTQSSKMELFGILMSVKQGMFKVLLKSKGNDKDIIASAFSDVMDEIRDAIEMIIEDDEE